MARKQNQDKPEPDVKQPSSKKKTAKKVFRKDARHTAILKKAGRIGSARAIRESKALGLPITYLKDGAIVKESADGSLEVIAKLPAPKTPKPSLKKGTILYAKK